jgi:hypothetical protein
MIRRVNLRGNIVIGDKSTISDTGVPDRTTSDNGRGPVDEHSTRAGR